MQITPPYLKKRSESVFNFVSVNYDLCVRSAEYFPRRKRAVSDTWRSEKSGNV